MRILTNQNFLIGKILYFALYSHNLYKLSEVQKQQMNDVVLLLLYSKKDDIS